MHVRKKENRVKQQGFYIYCCSSSWWNWKFDKIKLVKRYDFYITMWSIHIQSNITGTAQVFSRNAYCLVTDKRIWKTPAGLKKWIEKWVVLKLLMFDCILTKWWWCPPRFCNSVCSLLCLWVAGVEALLSIFSCCLVSVAVLVAMKCSYF
jgi:hypothetical protein